MFSFLPSMRKVRYVPAEKLIKISPSHFETTMAYLKGHPEEAKKGVKLVEDLAMTTAISDVVLKKLRVREATEEVRHMKEEHEAIERELSWGLKTGGGTR
mmetsp:Transcript_15998/g.36290  ORF Transcript_15998/g.36290 Transcript_15998/m.36290 type:complete len:100 (+) Transcript_15998:290-589(+)